MLPTPTEITYFLELYGTRHLSNSAIRLGIAQPSLSLSLQRLEKKIGSALFIRTKRGLVPTVAGNHFSVRAKNLVEAWGSLVTEFGDLSHELKGRFRLGCHPAVGAYCLPALLTSLTESAPDIELDVIHDFSRKIVERLVSYEIDLAYIVNPVRHPDLVLVKVGEDRVAFWKRRGDRVPPKRILADVTANQMERMIGKRHRAVFDGWTSFHSESLGLIRTLTLGGHGVGLLPERVALADSAHLVIFDSKLPTLRDEVYLAYRKDALTTAASKKLVKLATAVLERG